MTFILQILKYPFSDIHLRNYFKCISSLFKIQLSNWNFFLFPTGFELRTLLLVFDAFTLTNWAIVHSKVEVHYPDMMIATWLWKFFKLTLSQYHDMSNFTALIIQTKSKKFNKKDKNKYVGLKIKPGMSDLTPKCVRLASYGINPGLFQIRLQYIVTLTKLRICPIFGSILPKVRLIWHHSKSGGD